MKILGIESSCDETAASVVENGTKIISSSIASSCKLHQKTGGIIPEQAARQQIKSIIGIINQALIPLKDKKPDAIAVTVGPGLIGSLLVGVETAKTLAYLWKKPIIPVNHLVGHVYANWLDTPSIPKFPAIALVVSGGHTDLVYIKEHGKLQWLGGTRDDAAGEAFDKTARLLKLPYPGGPSISKKASLALNNIPENKLNILPRPMVNKKTYDFSFSGLKTAVLNLVNNEKDISQSEIAAQTQEAIVDTLISKTIKAVNEYKPRSLLLSGGVSANLRLRKKIRESTSLLEDKNLTLFIPPPDLCTDNASYIASCAYFNYKKVPWKKISADPQLTIMDL